MKKNNEKKPGKFEKRSIHPGLTFSTATEYIILAPSQIVYCMAEGNYSRLHLESGRTVFLCKQLGYLETLLPTELFARVHHSYLVNWTHVSGFLKKAGGQLRLSTGHYIPISRRRKQTLIRRLNLAGVPLIQ